MVSGIRQNTEIHELLPVWELRRHLALSAFFCMKDSGDRDMTACRSKIWIWFMQRRFCFLPYFFCGPYLAGFHPAAHGTEKFMDYGFMEAMMRSKTLPATDLWYSQGKINYYYGGQYFAVFLTKLSGTKVELTYNLMRTFVAAFAFVLPFSLVHQMTLDMQGRVSGWKKNLPSITGFLAGLAVSIAGNMHYVVYAQIIPLIQKLKGEEVSSYWFPDATRYIGFNPDVPDKTIHEFPCYSFVLGDLHAHVVNIMFVLLLLGLLYAWMKKVRNTTPSVEKQGRKKFWMKQLLMPQILAAAMLLGMFHWTNYWDFVIYYVVTGGTVLFMNIICLKGDIRRIAAVTAAQAVEIFAIATVIILPFTLQFDNNGAGRETGTESLPSTPASDPVGTSDSSDACICNFADRGETQRTGA